MEIVIPLGTMCQEPSKMNCTISWIFLVVLAAFGTGCISAPEALTTNNTGYLEGMDGVRLFYRIEGSGPDTVVVVHGGPGAGMDAVRPDFGPLKEGRTVIYYDQRGGGHSTLPDDTTRLEAQYHVGDLDAVRRFFGLGQMNVIAHSFGSVIVAEYARANPDRLGRVVFLGATGPRRSAAAAQARSRYAEADTSLRRELFEPLSALLSGTAEDPVAACEAYHEAGGKLAASLGEPLSKARGSECLMEPTALAYYFRYTAQVSPQSFGDWDYSSSLGSISAPLLVIYGDRDPEALAAQREWAEAVRSGGILAVHEAGKGVHVDRPDVVFPAIDVFLDGDWPKGARRRP